MDEKVQTRLLEFGLGGYGVVLAVEALTRMSPWLSGCLWLICFAITALGLPRLGLSRRWTFTARFAAAILTLALWVQTASRGHLKIDKAEILPDDVRGALPNAVYVNVYYMNN